MNFKGAMVLKACLMETGYLEDTRHTVDIDGNWYSDTLPTGDQMVESLQAALNKSGIELDAVSSECMGQVAPPDLNLQIDPQEKHSSPWISM